MSFLLDTNVVSELRKGRRCDARLRTWFERVDPDALYISVLLIGEVRRGIELVRRTDAEQTRVLAEWLEGLRVTYVDRLLVIDAEICNEWGRMRAIRPVSIVDGLMAATAKSRRLTLVTRNTGDVAGLGVTVLDPFA